ncbi:MAG: hypothetical protein GYB49_10580 [Alphaproteobacteria bacterium]|nr:hypothetical protein [Hyphomonas sp.]MBR9807654.1 hypothetical protein [Alphaproteobacteria bacterium]|tara:strand:+ start:1072 stop:1704 length:633 start_codon:yes stop_codon:yes gene_type:complete
MMISRYNDEDYLFNEYDWHGVVRANEEKIKEVAAQKSLKDFEQDFDVMVQELAAEYTPEAPELLTDDITVERKEVEVQRPRDRYNRDPFFSGNDTITRNAVEVTVPVSGDTGFFRVRPTSYDSGPPRARIASDHLVFTVIIDSDDTDKIRSNIDERVASIEKYLNWQRKSAEGLPDQMRALARRELEHRKQQLSSADDLVKGLGFKMKGD